jgi:hypothetical protein
VLLLLPAGLAFGGCIRLMLRERKRALLTGTNA